VKLVVDCWIRYYLAEDRSNPKIILIFLKLQLFSLTKGNPYKSKKSSKAAGHGLGLSLRNA